MTRAQVLLAEVEQELKTTHRFLERIPADKLTWKPHEKSMTAGQLGLHIAQLQMGVLAMSAGNEASPPDMRGGPEQPTSHKQMLDALEQGAAFVRQTLGAMDDRRLGELFRMTLGGRVLMELPREAFLRTVMFNHLYHHRGQLGAYLRLLGAKVPSSYGPSGDESPFGM